MWAGSVVVACDCCANWVNLARSAWGGVRWVCEVPAGSPIFVGEKGLLHVKTEIYAIVDISTIYFYGTY